MKSKIEALIIDEIKCLYPGNSKLNKAPRAGTEVISTIIAVDSKSIPTADQFFSVKTAKQLLVSDKLVNIKKKVTYY